MEARVAYGKGEITLRLPEGVSAEILEANEPEALADGPAAVAEAIARPIESPPLAELAEGKSSAVFSVPDATRPIPLDVILPPLLDAIAPSIPPERVLLLFATGMHRPVSADEARRLLGKRLAAEIHWESHDPERTRRLGTTTRGTAIDVDERFLDADLRVTVGLVEPHLLAGFSGGRKLVGPGLVSLETLRLLHGPAIIGHAKARAGILDGNPMHEEALAIAEASGLHFAVNVTIGKGRGLSGVFAGEPDRAHRKACNVIARTAGCAAAGNRDLVITCGGGSPLDATFYQSVKGIVGAEPVVRRGGTILLCTPGQEGWGSDSFLSLLRSLPDLDSFLAWANEPGHFIKDQWMVQHLREASAHCRVLLYSDHLDGAEAERLGLIPVRSPEEGVALAIDGIPNPSVAVVPKGPYTWIQPE